MSMLASCLPFLQIPLYLLVLRFNSASSTGDVQFAFQGFSGANLSLDGVSGVTSNGLLMLTDGTYPAKGHAFLPDPVRFYASQNGTTRSFSTSFVFSIVSEIFKLSDNGLAFVVAPTKDFSTASPAQYLGLLNASNNGKASNHIFAVEMDTILDPDFEDIDNNHVGIDINGLTSQQSHTAGYYDDERGEFQNLTLISRTDMQLWVDYDGNTTELNVTLAPVEVSKPKKPLLSATINLSTVISDTAYVGFSSSTGWYNTCHYVLGWSFSLDRAAPAVNYSVLPKLPRVGPKSRSKVLDIVLPIVTAAFVIALVAAILFFAQRQLRYRELHEDWEVEFGPQRFSYRVLFHATEGFKDENLLGVGGFGRVYKGVLPVSNTKIAVKKVSHGSRQGMKEFIAEVVTVGRIRHRNLVQLLGYCRREGELLLIYDFMSNGSLDKFLYSQEKLTLSWTLRFRIIRGIASSLLYLHEDCEQVVIHRDIKTSNVLLDDEMNGHLGDFGLAKLYDHGADPQTTRVAGTMGYLAPELVRTGKATQLTDVFAFGVLILEVTCARRPLQHDLPDNQLILMDWILEHWHKGSITDIMDPRLNGEYDMEAVILALKVGLLCAYPVPSERPSMHQVMQYLDGFMPAPEAPTTYISYSKLLLMQNNGFDIYATSQYPSRITSIGTMSGISGGR